MLCGLEVNLWCKTTITISRWISFYFLYQFHSSIFIYICPTALPKKPPFHSKYHLKKNWTGKLLCTYLQNWIKSFRERKKRRSRHFSFHCTEMQHLISNWIESNQTEPERHLKCYTLRIVTTIWQIQTSRQTIYQFKSENNFKFINQTNKPWRKHLDWNCVHIERFIHYSK